MQLSANNIPILSPNAAFEPYIFDVPPDPGEDNVVSAVSGDLLHAIIKGRNVQSRNNFLETLLADSPYKEHVKNRIGFKTSARFKEAPDRFLSELPEKQIVFDDVYHEGTCVTDRQTLKDKNLSEAGNTARREIRAARNRSPGTDLRDGNKTGTE